MIRREGFAFGWNASHEFLHFLTRRGSASQRRPCRKQLTVRSSAREMNQLAGRQIDGDKIVGRLGLLVIAGRMILDAQLARRRDDAEITVVLIVVVLEDHLSAMAGEL